MEVIVQDQGGCTDGCLTVQRVGCCCLYDWVVVAEGRFQLQRVKGRSCCCLCGGWVVEACLSLHAACTMQVNLSLSPCRMLKRWHPGPGSDSLVFSCG